MLVKLTSIAPYVAYNLAVPTLFAFLGIAAFGTTLGLVDAPGRRSRRTRRPVAAALLGTLFVSIVGNLGEIRVLADRAAGAIPSDWWFWNPTRLVHHPPTESGIITEFPWFTYLFGDLHAHAMALPFTVILVGLAVALLRPAPNSGASARWLHFLLFALVLGALWPLNTWDVPTYALLAVLALVGAWWAGPRQGPLRGVAALVLRSALLVALAYVFFLPFHRHYSGVFSGIERWHGSRTRLNDYLTVHGLFLFAIATAVVVDLATSNDLGGVARTYRAGLRSWDSFGRFRRLHGLLVQGSVAYRAALYVPPVVVALVVVLAALRLGVVAVIVALAMLTAVSTPAADAAIGRSRVTAPLARGADPLRPRLADHACGRVRRRKDDRRGPDEHRLQVLRPGLGALGHRVGGVCPSRLPAVAAAASALATGLAGGVRRAARDRVPLPGAGDANANQG